MNERIKGLVAIGASVAANCQPCLDYHVSHAIEMGISRDEIAEAAELAKGVRKGAAVNMDKFALNLIQKRMTMSPNETKACNCC